MRVVAYASRRVLARSVDRWGPFALLSAVRRRRSLPDGRRLEPSEHEVPARLVLGAQPLAVRAVLLPGAVLEQQLGAALGRPEAHLEDRGRLGLRRRVPGEHEPMRRVPSEGLAPAVLGAVGGDLYQPAADAALEPQLLHALAGDRVGGDGPPLADAAREEVEGRLDR